MSANERPEESYQRQREQVAEKWQDAEFTTELADVHWMASETVRRHLNLRVSGHPDVDWLTYFGGRYLRPRMHRVLVLGCGDGWLERSIATQWFIETIDAVDVAAGAVSRAEQTARALDIEKIHYHVRDLNCEPMPDGPYELVIAHSVIHHIENLNHFYSELSRVLASDGLLLINEYVGPKRFQYTDRQMTLINEILVALPERLRQSRLTGGVYEEKLRPTIEEMIANDPSEAVRSDEIVDQTQGRFAILERRPFGGSILHHLLYDIVQNFDESTKGDRAILDALCLFERSLSDHAQLPPDFEVIAAAKVPIRPTSNQGPAQSRDIPEPQFGSWDARIARLLPRRPVVGAAGARVRPLRQVCNGSVTGDANVDWLQQLIMNLPHPQHVLVVGAGAEDVRRLLRNDPRIASIKTARRPVRGVFDVVIALGAIRHIGDVTSLTSVVSPDGVLACINRTAASYDPWILSLADELLTKLPPQWPRHRGIRAKFRKLRATHPGATLSASEISEMLGRQFQEVRNHPISSVMTELIVAAVQVPAEPERPDSELLRVIATLEQCLLRNGLLDPSITLFTSRRSS